MDNLSSVESIVETVTSRLGYATLKKEQKDAILSFVVGRDVLVMLPTSYGKTIWYCCLPLIYNLLSTRSPKPQLMKIMYTFNNHWRFMMSYGMISCT